MRIRRLLLCGAIVGGTVFAAPGVAQASESPGELYKCLAQAAVDNGAVKGDLGSVTLEQLKKASESKKAGDLTSAAKDCYKAPNPVLPDLSEFLWGLAAFSIVLVGLIKFGFPMLKKGLAARESQIRSDLEGAAAAKTEAEREAGEYRASLGDARGEAGRIIDEARQSADQVRKDLIARAEEDAAQIRAKAAEDAKAATDRAMADVQAQVSDLSIQLAERIVRHNLDRDTQTQLIENYINEVGGTRR
jgi:F-type H+-transporting ATPase subunit b